MLAQSAAVRRARPSRCIAGAAVLLALRKKLLTRSLHNKLLLQLLHKPPPKPRLPARRKKRQMH